MTTKDTPNYYAIIPATVRYDDSLKANEKLLYWEISCLANKEGYCYANNNYFAELYWVTTQCVSGWINNLKREGYVDIKLIYKEGGKQIINRHIFFIGEGIKEKINSPINKKIKDNSIKDNNINNNNKKYIKKEEVELVYTYYLSSIKKKGHYNMKWNKKALSLERIKKALKRFDTTRLLCIIDLYTKANKEQISGGYAKACQYFFGAVERGSSVMYYDDYIEGETKTETKTTKAVDITELI